VNAQLDALSKLTERILRGRVTVDLDALKRAVEWADNFYVWINHEKPEPGSKMPTLRSALFRACGLLNPALDTPEWADLDRVVEAMVDVARFETDPITGIGHVREEWIKRIEALRAKIAATAEFLDEMYLAAGRIPPHPREPTRRPEHLELRAAVAILAEYWTGTLKQKFTVTFQQVNAPDVRRSGAKNRFETVHPDTIREPTSAAAQFVCSVMRQIDPKCTTRKIERAMHAIRKERQPKLRD
jgi:hypothetical protein